MRRARPPEVLSIDSFPIKKVSQTRFLEAFTKSIAYKLSRDYSFFDGRCASRISSKFSPAPENASRERIERAG